MRMCKNTRMYSIYDSISTVNESGNVATLRLPRTVYTNIFDNVERDESNDSCQLDSCCELC